MRLNSTNGTFLCKVDSTLLKYFIDIVYLIARQRVIKPQEGMNSNYNGIKGGSSHSNTVRV